MTSPGKKGVGSTAADRGAVHRTVQRDCQARRFSLRSPPRRRAFGIKMAQDGDGPVESTNRGRAAAANCLDLRAAGVKRATGWKIAGPGRAAGEGGPGAGGRGPALGGGGPATFVYGGGGGGRVFPPWGLAGRYDPDTSPPLCGRDGARPANHGQ